MNIKLNSKLKP